MMSIADFRREYNLGVLKRKDLEGDPLAQFKKWFEQAIATRPSSRVRKFVIGLYKALLGFTGAPPVDITAMTLATADKSGRPSARVVLLKGVDERGFIFFTNYDSRKGEELEQNPQAALVFYWPELERQVCIAGRVTKVDAAESDAYFLSRPRGSRLAACVSPQSKAVRDREELVKKWKECETHFANQEVTRPANWGGYILSPERMEFWQGGANRLHDRFSYTRQKNGQWEIKRLAP